MLYPATTYKITHFHSWATSYSLALLSLQQMDGTNPHHYFPVVFQILTENLGEVQSHNRKINIIQFLKVRM